MNLPLLLPFVVIKELDHAKLYYINTASYPLSFSRCLIYTAIHALTYQMCDPVIPLPSTYSVVLPFRPFPFAILELYCTYKCKISIGTHYPVALTCKHQSPPVPATNKINIDPQ